MVWKGAIMGRAITLTPKACDNYRLEKSTSPDRQLHELAAGGKGGAACAALVLMNSAREAGFYVEVFTCKSVYRKVLLSWPFTIGRAEQCWPFFVSMLLAASRRIFVDIRNS
jgi:hypothetical protein